MYSVLYDGLTSPFVEADEPAEAQRGAEGNNSNEGDLEVGGDGYPCINDIIA